MLIKYCLEGTAFNTINDLENAFSKYTQNFIKQALDDVLPLSEHEQRKEPEYHLDNNNVKRAISDPCAVHGIPEIGGTSRK